MIRKIVIYHPYLNIVGGAEVVIRELIGYLSENEKDVYVVSHDREIGMKGIQHISIPTYNDFKFNFKNNLKISKEIKKKLENIDYDLMLLSNVPPVIDYTLTRIKKGKIFYWCHEPRRSLFYKEIGDKEPPGLGLVAKTRIMLYKKLSKMALSNSDKIIVYSNFIEQVVTKNIGIMKDKIVRIPWGIKTKDIEYSEVKETKRILYVGRINEAKNTFRLMDAMKEVSKKHKDAKMYIAGPLGEYEKNLFKKKLQECEGSVEYLGIKVGKELHKLYELSQLVVYPTINEPWGLVPLEAMAHARPVIVGNGGPRETVLNGVTGYHVNPYNTKEIAEKISTLLNNFELCREMGRAARTHVEKNFDITRTYKLIDITFS